eukprot:gene12552-8601_t
MHTRARASSSKRRNTKKNTKKWSGKKKKNNKKRKENQLGTLSVLLRSAFSLSPCLAKRKQPKTIALEVGTNTHYRNYLLEEYMYIDGTCTLMNAGALRNAIFPLFFLLFVSLFQYSQQSTASCESSSHMKIYCLLLVAWFVASTAVVGSAIKVEVREVLQGGAAPVAAALTFPYQFSPNFFCFTAAPLAIPSADDVPSDAASLSAAVCSTDGGRSFFYRAPTSDGFCGSAGVVLEGNTLLCARQEEMQLTDGGETATFPTTVFSPTEGGFTGAPGTDDMTVDLKPSNFQAEKVVLWKAIYVESKNEFYRTATLSSTLEGDVEGEGGQEGPTTLHSALLRSQDGYRWEYVSRLPFDTIEPIFIFFRGIYVGVAAKTEPADPSTPTPTYRFTYFNDVAKRWAPVKEGTTDVLPQAATLPTGLVLEAGNLENTTAMDMKLSVAGVPTRKMVSMAEYHSAALPQAALAEGSVASILGVFPGLPSEDKMDEKRMQVVYQVCQQPSSSAACDLFTAVLGVDDASEMAAKEQRAEEEQRKRDAKRREAEEAKARRQRLREERLRKREAKRKEFEAYDAPFMAAAKEQAANDGEMIVVRRGVLKPFIEFEKETNSNLRSNFSSARPIAIATVETHTPIKTPLKSAYLLTLNLSLAARDPCPYPIPTAAERVPTTHLDAPLPHIDMSSVDQQAVAPHRRFRTIKHTVKIIARNALVAVVIRVLFGVAKALARKGLSKAFLKSVEREIFSLNPPKWACVVAGISSFRLTVELMEAFSSKVYHIPKKPIPFVCGCICALPALVMNNSTRTELALYAFVRALHTFELRFIFPHLPRPMRSFQHYDVLLMCLCSSQISYGALFAQSTLPPSYVSFLMRASLYDDRFVRGHASYMRSHITPDLVAVSLEKNWPLLAERTKESEAQLCKFVHEGYSCNTWALNFVWQNILKMGIPLYGPLRVMSVLVFDRKRLLSDPIRVLKRSVWSVGRSSLFLGLYIACFIRSSCYALQHGGRGGKLSSLLSFFAGFSTLLEPKGRRMDLALYCLTFSLRSFMLTQYRLGRLPYPRSWFLFLLYVVSMGYMFFEYEEEPDLLNHRVRDAFRKLLGGAAEAPRRDPSWRVGHATPAGPAAGRHPHARRPLPRPVSNESCLPIFVFGMERRRRGIGTKESSPYPPSRSPFVSLVAHLHLLTPSLLCPPPSAPLEYLRQQQQQINQTNFVGLSLSLFFFFEIFFLSTGLLLVCPFCLYDAYRIPQSSTRALPDTRGGWSHSISRLAFYFLTAFDIFV